MAYAYKGLIPENIALPGATGLRLLNKLGMEIAASKLPQRMKYPSSGRQYSFLALSDVHITYNTAAEDFQRALQFAETKDVKFTCICGDLTDYGTASQMGQYKSIIDANAPTKPVYAIAGNHETINAAVVDSYIQQYTGKPLYYSYGIGADGELKENDFSHVGKTYGDTVQDVFVMVGNYACYSQTAKDFLPGEQFSVAELQWLYETLEANRGKRCIVFQHIFPWGGVGNAGGYYKSNFWRGSTEATQKQANCFEALMKHYKNVVWFHGHSHLKFYLQEIDKKANYSAADGYRSVHIPSLSVPRDIQSGALTTIYADSEGYQVDVFEDKLVLRGRDFIDNGQDGTWLPIATYKIDTPIAEVVAGTFTDPSGIITT